MLKNTSLSIYYRMVISLIPKSVAQKGYQFIHLGGTETCQKCQFLAVCVNSLEKGSTYEVTKVREKEHPCMIDNTMMIVCELKQINDKLSVKHQKYLDDVIVTRDLIDCTEVLCDNYDFCILDKYSTTTKVKILKVIKEMKCPLGYKLVLVEGKKVKN